MRGESLVSELRVVVNPKTAVYGALGTIQYHCVKNEVGSRFSVVVRRCPMSGKYVC